MITQSSRWFGDDDFKTKKQGVFKCVFNPKCFIYGKRKKTTSCSD